MTKLLVSVRNAHEAELAYRAGADLIDVKEPNRGALGAADAETVRDVTTRLAGRAPVSVALGELCPAPPATDLHHLRGVAYAKIGLAGCMNVVDWKTKWRTLLEAVSAMTHPVAVVYADWRSAAAPSPDLIVEHAPDLGCVAVLVDTHDKKHGGLLSHWSLDEVARFVAQTQARGLKSVVAGSLDLETAGRVCQAAPDYVGVRGAVCRGGRAGELDAAKVRSMAQMLGGQGRRDFDGNRITA